MLSGISLISILVISILQSGIMLIGILLSISMLLYKIGPIFILGETC